MFRSLIIYGGLSVIWNDLSRRPNSEERAPGSEGPTNWFELQVPAGVDFSCCFE